MSDAKMKCRFPECAGQPTLAQAWVPELAVLRRVAKGEVTVKTLAENAHCADHARAGRRQGLRFYSYMSTVQELNRRQAEHAKSRDYFQCYGAAKGAGTPKRSKPSPTAKPEP